MNSKKNLAPQKGHKALIAVVLSCVLILATGTWAWKSFQSLRAENNMRLAGSYDVELHDVYGGEEQIAKSSDLKNGGAQPTPVSITGKLNVPEEKRIWISNPADSQAVVFGRLKLTESLVGGDAGYTGTFTTFKGTDATGVVNPALIGWSFGSTIRDITTWNGTDYGDFWLMDTDTGYAYWMNPIYPGYATEDFLSSIVGMQANETPVDYTIQVEADAISATVASDRSQWAASANDAKLDQLFTLYQGLADSSRVVFRDINGTTGTDVADFKAAFPADAMQALVQDVVDSNGDSLVTQQELNAVTHISNSTDTGFVKNITSPVTSLNGIEQFPYLRNIDILSDSSLSGRIDLTENLMLTRLNIQNCAITEVDASRNQVLERMFLGNNQITDIQLPAGATVLSILSMANNQLESLDLTNQKKLSSIQLQGNRITSLDISYTSAGVVTTTFIGSYIANNGMTSLIINSEQSANSTLLTQLQNSAGNALSAPGAITVRD